MFREHSILGLREVTVICFRAWQANHKTFARLISFDLEIKMASVAQKQRNLTKWLLRLLPIDKKCLKIIYWVKKGQNIVESVWLNSKFTDLHDFNKF